MNRVTFTFKTSIHSSARATRAGESADVGIDHNERRAACAGGPTAAGAAGAP
jgi:hypothetical protein